MDRVHPSTAADYSGEMNNSSQSSDPSSSPLYSFHFEKESTAPLTSAAAGAYVVQVPKDQVFRVPPPQNARLYERYTRRAARGRSRSCFSVCTRLLFAVFVMAVLIAVAAGIFYLLVRPKPPSYSFEALSVSGLDGLANASASGGAFSPEFRATIRTDNPNAKIGINYDEGSSVAVSYNGVNLAKGAWPAFYQAPGNVTVFIATARGAGIWFSESMRGEMATGERLGSVPLTVRMSVPARINLGAATTWAIDVKVRCDVVVDKLAAKARLVSKKCKVKMDF